MRNVSTFSWPAPVRGWITSGNLAQAPMDAAERLDNWFPTAQGAEVRRGSRKHATLSDAGVRLFRYIQGDTAEMFGSTSATVEPIGSPADADVAETPILTGLGSGEWSTVQFGNAASVFMIAVNGTDHGWYYNGTDVQPLVSVDTFNLPYDALSADFTVGQTVTGGTSGATAEIIAVLPTSATVGTLKVGAITGTFQDNEALTDAGTGAAVANIPSGTSAASVAKITGVETKDLAQVWLHKNRLFFVEKDTMNAWYLPVDSIGGAASKFRLASVFSRGGNLLFGANWSLDSGEGLDDKCVFVTDQGEVAVYGGTDPANANTWSLEGVYQIGKPVDKYAHYQLGGELMLVTDDGIVPISQAVARSYSELFQAAQTAPIEDRWKSAIARRSGSDPVEVTYWPREGKLIVTTPEKVNGLSAQYVCNTRYNTWCRYVGWDMRCGTVYNDDFYFADGNGNVFQGETGGNDAGSAYTVHFVPKFSDLGTPGLKTVNQVSAIMRSPVPVRFKSKVFVNYEEKTLPVPEATPAPDESSVWGTAIWGTSKWGGESVKVGKQTWKAAGGTGFAIAGTVSVTINQVAPPEIELISTQIRFEVGNPL